MRISHLLTNCFIVQRQPETVSDSIKLDLFFKAGKLLDTLPMVDTRREAIKNRWAG